VPVQYQCVRKLARPLQSIERRRSDGPTGHKQGVNIMVVRLESVQRVAFSLVGSLVFAALMVSAAVPVVPVA